MLCACRHLYPSEDHIVQEVQALHAKGQLAPGEDVEFDRTQQGQAAQRHIPAANTNNYSNNSVVPFEPDVKLQGPATEVLASVSVCSVSAETAGDKVPVAEHTRIAESAVIHRPQGGSQQHTPRAAARVHGDDDVDSAPRGQEDNLPGTPAAQRQAPGSAGSGRAAWSELGHGA